MTGVIVAMAAVPLCGIVSRKFTVRPLFLLAQFLTPSLSDVSLFGFGVQVPIQTMGIPDRIQENVPFKHDTPRFPILNSLGHVLHSRNRYSSKETAMRNTWAATRRPESRTRASIFTLP